MRIRIVCEYELPERQGIPPIMAIQEEAVTKMHALLMNAPGCAGFKVRTLSVDFIKP